MAPQKRPSFTEAWLDDLRDDLRRYGKRALVPWVALSCIGVGAGVSLLVPKEHFWDKPEVSVVFFTAAVTINGLLLALSWGSFAKIYELASEPKMASFLRRHDLLKDYIFHVNFIHVAQVLALSWSSIALVLCVVDHLPRIVSDVVSLLTLQKIALAGAVAHSIYALKYALGAVRIMQDLVWNSTYLLGDGAERDITVHEGGRDRGT
jgi:hypothetical protein